MIEVIEKMFDNAGQGWGRLAHRCCPNQRGQGRPSTRRPCPRFVLLGEVQPMDQQLARARAALVAAEIAEVATQRFSSALVAAGWVALGLVWARTGQEGNAALIWRTLPRIAPELGEWAACFDQATGKLQAAAQRRYQLSMREADDLLRDAQTFYDLVGRRWSKVEAERGTA